MSKSTALENLVAEQIVLGAILQSADSYWRVADILAPQHFSRRIHGEIYAAVKDILTDGKKHSLTLIESRIGPEYEDGKSTSAYLSALVRDAEEQQAALDSVDDIVDLWRQRKLIELGEHMAKEAKKSTVNSTDLLAEMEVRLQDISVNSQAEPIKWLGEIATKVMTKSTSTRSTGTIPGFDTGLPSMDEILGRIHGGDLGVCGASPGDGKTLFAAQLAMRAQMYGPTIYFQLEMKDEDMAARSLAGETNISVSAIEAGTYDAFEHEDLVGALAKLQKTRIIIDDRPKLAIEQIHDRCVAVKRRHGLVFAVIDHIRLVRTNQRAKDKWERSEIVTGDAKALAKDLGIAVCMLSQVTRASQRRADDPSPRLNDFDGGSSIEQDADWALSLFRRDRWLKTQRPHDPESKDFTDWAADLAACRGRIRATCLKRRRGEDGEHRDFTFDGRRGRLIEIDR